MNPHPPAFVAALLFVLSGSALSAALPVASAGTAAAEVPARAWTAVPSASPGTLNAVALAASAWPGGPPRGGWAVGDGGAIVRLRQGRWEAVASPVTTDLNAVAVAPSGEAWAVGDKGTVLQFADGQWKRFAHDVAADFSAVSVGRDGTVLIAGRRRVGDALSGAIYRVGPDGLSVQPAAELPDGQGLGLTGPPIYNDVAVWDDLYWVAVGTVPTKAGLGQIVVVQDCEEARPDLAGLVRCHDRVEIVQASDHRGQLSQLLSVDLSDRDAYVVGGSAGGLFRNGPDSGYGPILAPVADYRDVATDGSSEAWLVAGLSTPLHLVGETATWSKVLGPGAKGTLRAIDVAPNGEGWAVGSGAMAHLPPREVRLCLPWVGSGGD